MKHFKGISFLFLLFSTFVGCNSNKPEDFKAYIAFAVDYEDSYA